MARRDVVGNIRRSQRTESVGRRSNKLKISEDVYEITYDYDDEWSGGGTSSETFEGSWQDLQDYIKQLRASGCYNIDATCVDGCYESYSGLNESSDGGVVIKTDSKEGKYYLTKSSTKQKTFWSTDIKKANVFAKKDSAMNKLYTVLQKLPENAFYDEDTAFDLEDESELKGAKFAKFYITDTSGKEIEDISKEVKDHLLSDDKFISSIFDEDMDESYSRLNESSEEIARKLFVSLVKLYPYGYSVLNDGNFVCRISAKDDEDAIRQFNDFLKTDWKSAWRNGTLPKYFGESRKRVARRCLREDVRADLEADGYKYVTSKIFGGRYYEIYRKVVKGENKGYWKAVEKDSRTFKPIGEPFDITWEQASGFEPIRDTGFSRAVGKALGFTKFGVPRESYKRFRGKRRAQKDR